MIIRFYGTRGSIPVAGKGTKKYGGNTTCLYVESKYGEVLVIDAGTGIRQLGVHLIQNKKEKIHLLFTHYHWDHIQGFPFFVPVFIKNNTVKIYGSKKESTTRKALSYQMTRPYFPVEMNLLPAKISYHELQKRNTIAGITIQTIVNNHPNYTLGLKLSEGKRSFVLLTDNELYAKNGNTPYEDFVEFIKGVDFCIHDAQYTEEIYDKRIGWGHSTYTQVMRLVKDAGVKKVFFTHHDHGSDDQTIDSIVKKMKKQYPRVAIEAAADGKKVVLK